MAVAVSCCQVPAVSSGSQQEPSRWSILRSLPMLLGGRARRPAADLPKYWTRSQSELGKEGSSGSCSNDNLDAPAAEDHFYPVPLEDRRVLETLMNRTSKDREVEFHLVRAVRLENPDLWKRYQERAARVKRRRGRCTFAGRGRPMTTCSLAGVEELSDGFPAELDSEICEAYLWHATKPQAAAKILREGFRISQRSAVGKRFGCGGYFSEDAAKADAYSAAGEGIYKDCYAMLLCRVVLGKQLHTNLFRWEGAAQQAAGAHDALVAEPRCASYREYVALEDAQIYPEFALVYERRPVQTASTCLTRSISPDAPMYWTSGASCGQSVHRAVSDPEVLTCVQSLMDLTWVRAFTWERKDSKGTMIYHDDPNHDMPEGITVLKVLRLEDSDMWGSYRQTRHQIRSERHGQQVARSPHAEQLHVRTARTDLPLCARADLDQSVNEVYLWHGCSPQAAMSILERGFPEQPGCGGTGRRAGMFGEGYYLVDCTSKADEHSEDDKEGFYRGYYAMLLCRVVLGNAEVTDKADMRAHERVGRGRAFDSTVGFQEASDGTFSEFVVPERSQIYPEYAIVYERIYSTPRVR
mmetsp:Transcript_37076/g.106520  ORF Transcript_37076/g.106520 Transcript_37076/m.106520 type:complete len:582 (+) Transcript_37076:61-1806(+)